MNPRNPYLVIVVGIWIARSHPPMPAQTDPEELHARAEAGLQSFLVKYWNGAYLRDVYPGGEFSQTHYWTFAQGFDALLDGVERTGGQRYGGLVESFVRAQERNGWFSPWFDDMNWMALALTRAFDLTGERSYLDRAAWLFAEIRSAWDTSCCGPEPGGIWWDEAHSQKATASNAGPVITAVRLAERLEDSSYIDFAIQVYEYWFDEMVDLGRWHVWDHINPDGEKVDWQFSYNEGLMIGAGVELYRATGDGRYLLQARNIGRFLCREVVRSTSLGPVLSDGGNTSCTGDCHAFKGIAYRYLALLQEYQPDPLFEDVLEASGEAIWQRARHPDEILFSIDWGGPSMTTFSEAQMAAAVMALNVHATRRGPYPGSGSPDGRFEAEDATIDLVLLDNLAGGYTGWGYVTRFDRPGQFVRFRCDAPVGGRYEATLRYAARQGEASRRILVDGKELVDNLVFPETPGAEVYGSVRIELDLARGEHSIEVRHDFASGNTGSLDLDHLQLTRPPALFIRGDGNDDGTLDISDPVFNLEIQFLAGVSPGCLAPLDTNADGLMDLSDPVYSLEHQFLGQPPPPLPFPGCGPESLAGGEALPCDMQPASCSRVR